MKVEVLQTFVAVAEQQGFAKAGEMLFLSQPTVSRYIAELEGQMGGALLERNAHMCELTPLGRQVYVHARRIVNEWEAVESLGNRRDLAQKALRVGYTYDEILKFIAPAISEFSLIPRNEELTALFGEGTMLTQLLKAGRLDCAVMHLPSLSNAEGLSVRRIRSCQMCLHVASHHRLADKKSVKLEQLIYETDVRIQSEQNYYTQVDGAFAGLSLQLPNHIYVQQAVDCLPVILGKGGIVFLPDIYSAWPGCVKVPIEDWTTDFSLVFVTDLDHMTEATERLYKAMCDNLSKH